MANSAWQATIQNDAGDIVPAAEITVLHESTGLPATVFSSVGGAALANPFPADSKGFAQFYAAAGTYRIIAEDTGTAQTSTHRYVRLGEAASRDVGISNGEVPDASQGFHTGNLNPNVFGGIGSFRFLGAGEAISATDGKIFLPISALLAPASITTVSAFDVVNANVTSLYASGIGVSLDAAGSSSNKLCVITFTGGSGMTAGQAIYLRQSSGTSKITVNF